MNGISFGTSRTVRNTVVVHISGVLGERGSAVVCACVYTVHMHYIHVQSTQ